MATDYLLDMQPGLHQVLMRTTGSDVTRFVKQGNRVLRQEVNDVWQPLLTDHLGSVRSVFDDLLQLVEVVDYSPYGTGQLQESMLGFTGEPSDSNGLVHLRARYYDPALGVFPSLDPVEGTPMQPQSLNEYSWVEGNVPNATDPTGLYWWGTQGIPNLDNYSPDTSTQNDKDTFISKTIQYMLSESPLLNEIFHAEYMVNEDLRRQGNTQRPVDLLKVNADQTKIEIWEVKPNNRGQRRDGRHQRDENLQIAQQVVADSSRRSIYTSNEYPNPHYPNFSYDWSMFSWVAGTSLPPKFPIGYVIPYRERWYAGQIEPGLVVYWRENNPPDDDIPIPGAPARSIPKDVSDERGQTVSPPNNIIQFPQMENTTADIPNLPRVAITPEMVAVGGGIFCLGVIVSITPVPFDDAIFWGTVVGSTAGG